MPRAQVKVDWDAVKADSTEFAHQLLRDPAGKPVIPTPAQEQILRGIKRYTTIVTGRQFGKTMALGIDCTTYAASLGESVAEGLADISAKCYKFTSQSKWEIVQELARALAEHSWLLPYDRTIIDE